MNTNDTSLAAAIHGPQHTTLTELVSPADRISELEQALRDVRAWAGRQAARYEELGPHDIEEWTPCLDGPYELEDILSVVPL